jgi:hypothetical protein
MSALGHKQTCAPQKAMSALPLVATAKADMPQMVMSAFPPKADMCSAQAHVCFGPIADIRSYSITACFHRMRPFHRPKRLSAKWQQRTSAHACALTKH